MKDLLFPKINLFDFGDNDSFPKKSKNFVCHGTESVSYRGPKILDLVPNEIKQSETVTAFKFRIKGCIPERCPCRISKVYLGQMGFMLR